jgi:hypothetical protein
MSISIQYKDVNYYAWSGTAANLVKLLQAFGHDKDAVIAMQKGVKGYQRVLDGWGNVSFEAYKTPAIEKSTKDDIMADFYAKQGVFAPKKPEADALKELTNKFNEQAKQIEELKKTIEALKKTPPDYPSIH